MKRPAPIVTLLWRQSAIAASRLRQIHRLERGNTVLLERLEDMTRARDRARDDVELVLRMVPDKQFALALLRDAHTISAQPEYRR